jgi:hypothetical protein
MAIVKDAAYWKDVEEQSKELMARYNARVAQKEAEQHRKANTAGLVPDQHATPSGIPVSPHGRTPASVELQASVSPRVEATSGPSITTAPSPIISVAPEAGIPSSVQKNKALTLLNSLSLASPMSQVEKPEEKGTDMVKRKQKAHNNDTISASAAPATSKTSTARPATSKPVSSSRSDGDSLSLHVSPTLAMLSTKQARPNTSFSIGAGDDQTESQSESSSTIQVFRPTLWTKILSKGTKSSKRPRDEGQASQRNSGATSPVQLGGTASNRMPKKQRMEELPVTTGPSRSNDIDSLPAWYVDINTSNSPKRRKRDVEVKLPKIGELILNLKKAKPTPYTLHKAFDNIRDEIHELEFIVVNKFCLKKAHLLDNDRGLPQIFKKEHSGGINYPDYIQDDAKLLYMRWSNEVFEQNLFKGIDNMIKRKDKTGGPKIDEKCKKEWRYFGNHDLVNGQWWGNQLAAVRDGAHGSAQGGIAGIKGQGATSIVLSGDVYKETDRDEGDLIWYSGTKNTRTKGGSWPSDPTDGTQRLLESEEYGNPVRVMRSAALPTSNAYRPKKGFRFDGLYEVLSYRVVDAVSKHYVFRLKRRPGQADIRYRGVEARPTQQQIEQYDMEMRKYGWKGGVL